MSIWKEIKSDQEEIDEFVQLIQNPDTLICRFGAIGFDGLFKSSKEGYINPDFTHINSELLGVIHGKKPTSTFIPEYVCGTQYPRRKLKMGIVQEYARLNGVFIIPYFKRKVDKNYGYEVLYLAFKPENLDQSLFLCIRWMHTDTLSSFIDQQTLDMIEEFLEGWSESEQVIHIINGVLLGYPRGDLYGWTLRKYIDSKVYEQGYTERKEQRDISMKEITNMTQEDQEMFKSRFESWYIEGKQIIESKLISSDFIEIKERLKGYIQIIPPINLDLMGINLKGLH